MTEHQTPDLDADKKRLAAAERREQIVDAALEVFAEKGFDAATTKEIAAAAGIKHAGLLYHYFQKKADLLMAVVEKFSPPFQLAARPEEFAVLAPREALTRFASAYLQLRDRPLYGPFVRVMLREALLDPKFAEAFAETGPLRVWRFLSEYLANQMEIGALRRADPALAALTFIGPLITTVLLSAALRQPSAHVNSDALIPQHVDCFLRGMAADVEPNHEHAPPFSDGSAKLTVESVTPTPPRYNELTPEEIANG